MAGCVEAPGAPEGVGRHISGRFLEVDEDGAWIVEGLYDVVPQDVGWFFVFTKPLDTVK